MVGAIELLLHFPRQTCIFAQAAQFGSCLRQAGVTFLPEFFFRLAMTTGILSLPQKQIL